MDLQKYIAWQINASGRISHILTARQLHEFRFGKPPKLYIEIETESVDTGEQMTLNFDLAEWETFKDKFMRERWDIADEQR